MSANTRDTSTGASERIILSEADFERFAAALDNPPPPAPALLEMARRYREKIADGTLVVEHDTEEGAVESAEESADRARGSAGGILHAAGTFDGDDRDRGDGAHG